jgi:hypothetical protein
MMGATAAVGVVALGTGMSAYGQHKAGRDAEKLYDNNALLAEYQSQDALERGVVEERTMRRQTNKVIGAQRANLAAQGVDVNKGSALDVQADAAYLGELDAITIRNNAAKEAWGYRVAATDARARGDIARREGTFGAFTTILDSAGSLLLANYGPGWTRTRYR